MNNHPPTTSLTLPGGRTLALARVPAGEFVMGSGAGLPLERPPHRVTFARPFLLGVYPVTQGQWRAVMGANPSEFVGEDLPVDSVSWDDARDFCRALSALGGAGARLPSEAEWEYACRAGSTREYFFGDEEADLPGFAWFDLNSAGGSRPVGSKSPNAWGIYDMAGNVWEWCRDVWHGDYAGEGGSAAPDDGSAWTQGEAAQPRRVLRGGSWNYDAFRCRCAYRSRDWKHFATNHFGLRVAADARD